MNFGIFKTKKGWVILGLSKCTRWILSLRLCMLTTCCMVVSQNRRLDGNNKKIGLY